MKQIIPHTFTKAEIETLDFQRFDGIFGHWPQLWSRELVEKFDSLVFIVDGFDDNPKEIYCIPGIRKFYRELHRRWPWWAFFLNCDAGTMLVAYLCLIESVASCKQEGQTTCAVSFEPKELLDILHHDFGRLNYLRLIAGMSDEANDQRANKILKIFSERVSHG